MSVAVLPVKDETLEPLADDDVQIITQGGHGPGGQHQNRTESAVRARHLPTGIEVVTNGRDQHANRRTARRLLTAKVYARRRDERDRAYGAVRREQVVGGHRAGKIRTYNFILGRAVDHRTGKKTRRVADVIEKGRFELLLNDGEPEAS